MYLIGVVMRAVLLFTKPVVSASSISSGDSLRYFSTF
jgi:hypothetical protein